MKTLSKYAVAAALTGALALAAATPSQARWYGHGGWHKGGAAAIGFGAGALVGAAVAGATYPGYYGYDDGAGYAYAPGPYETYGDDSYAYAPGADSYAYAPGRYSGYRSHQGRNCIQSPASMNYTSCD
jgi:hypothetical protein